MIMVVQQIAYLIEDKNQTITVEALGSKETFEANVYLLSRSLATIEKLSGDNIKVSVNEQDFEGLKKYFGK